MKNLILQLDKTSDVPLYQQIYRQISGMIDNGTLLPGDKLPTERKLCEDYAITRATIKTAYNLLKNNGKITALRGSGSYIAKRDSASVIKAAQQSICTLLTHFPENVISSNELLALFQSELKKRSITPRSVEIALIDCCVECLDMAKAQLSSLRNVNCSGILLHDFTMHPEKLVQNAELIFTTPKHYSEVARLIPQKLDILKTVDLDFTTSSTIELARIKSDSTVMVLCNDRYYKTVMADELTVFNNLNHVIYMTNDDSDDAIKRQLRKADALILCKVYANFAKKNISQAIDRFKKSGKKVVYCEYILDKGSFQYSKRQVNQLLETHQPVAQSYRPEADTYTAPASTRT